MVEPANRAEVAAATEMMSTIERARSRCCRAFYAGRLRLATRTIAWTVPITIVSVVSRPGARALLLCVPFSVLVFVFAFIGGGWKQALRPGLHAGLALSLLPCALVGRRPCLSACESCSSAWIVASVVAAGVLALYFHSGREGRRWAGIITLALSGPLPILDQ